MPKLTVFFGILLVAVSIGFFTAITPHTAAALHPAGLGILVALCGLLALSPDARRRRAWMHLAILFAFIGLLITGIRALIELAHGFASILVPAAFYERVTIALLCLLFVALCVRSFIAARRTPAA